LDLKVRKVTGGVMDLRVNLVDLVQKEMMVCQVLQARKESGVILAKQVTGEELV